MRRTNTFICIISFYLINAKAANGRSMSPTSVASWMCAGPELRTTQTRQRPYNFLFFLRFSVIYTVCHFFTDFRRIFPGGIIGSNRYERTFPLELIWCRRELFWSKSQMDLTVICVGELGTVSIPHSLDFSFEMSHCVMKAIISLSRFHNPNSGGDGDAHPGASSMSQC